MKTIGIKLADGSFYPVMNEGEPCKKNLNLTTVKDNQTIVQVDLYRSEKNSVEDAEYVDTLQIKNLLEHPNGEPNISLDLILDEDNRLSAQLHDPESGGESHTEVTLVTRTPEERGEPTNFKVSNDYAENEVTENNETIAEDEALPDIDFSDFDDTTAEQNDAVAFTNGTAPISTEDTDLNDEDFNQTVLDKNADESTDTNETNMIDDTTLTSEALPQETEPLDETLPDIDFSDFDDTTTLENDTTTLTSETSPAFNETTSNEDNSFGDMDFDIPDFPEDNTTTNFDSTDGITQNYGNQEDTLSATDNFASNAGGLDFSNLYDKETEEGISGTEEEIHRKTKIPVLICIICAIICVLAVIFIFIKYPSEFNFLSQKDNKSNAQESFVKNTTTEDTPSPVYNKNQEQEQVAPKAKEDEVVVAPVAEVVVPEVEEVKPIPVETKTEKSSNIRYKVKWGDTLWDISSAYYKNPWRYKKIAKYNGIKNPDYILAGTYITIPAD